MTMDSRTHWFALFGVVNAYLITVGRLPPARQPSGRPAPADETAEPVAVPAAAGADCR
jgi:hypothetical protein